jgi:hypothetical protein
MVAVLKTKDNSIVFLPLSHVLLSPSLSFVFFTNFPAAVGRPGVAAPPSEKLKPPPFFKIFAVFKTTLLHLFIYALKVP